MIFGRLSGDLWPAVWVAALCPWHGHLCWRCFASPSRSSCRSLALPSWWARREP